MGPQAQARLAAARVLIVGCGALGTVIADQLARAGVGHLRIADRDVVELTNLQRQVLFNEADACEGTPKAVAAGRRLREVNSSVTIEPLVMDVHAENIEELAGIEPGGTRVDLIFDGTDNVETRYLINDLAVKHGLPWVYGACVGMVGRVMMIRPGASPCLQCIFPTPPAPGEMPTCDTAGVLGSAVAVVASLQVIEGIKLLTGNIAALNGNLATLDLWTNRFRGIDTGLRRDDCECCGRRHFEFLERAMETTTVHLCGRNSVQIRPARSSRAALPELAARLRAVGEVQQTEFLVRCKPTQEAGVVLTIFSDGRTIIQGTNDFGRARALLSRYVGS